LPTQKLLEAIGFEELRVTGSHHVFGRAGIPEQLNLQDRSGQAKPYQLRQLVGLVRRYDPYRTHAPRFDRSLTSSSAHPGHERVAPLFQTATRDFPPRAGVQQSLESPLRHRPSRGGCGLRLHVESLAELIPAEEPSVGRVLADGTRVLADVVGSVKSYVMLFAEGTKHLNFRLVPRMADIPEHPKGAAVSGYDAERPGVDDTERAELAERLVVAWPGRS
jgi:hypothetical protein